MFQSAERLSVWSASLQLVLYQLRTSSYSTDSSECLPMANKWWHCLGQDCKHSSSHPPAGNISTLGNRIIFGFDSAEIQTDGMDTWRIPVPLVSPVNCDKRHTHLYSIYRCCQILQHPLHQASETTCSWYTTVLTNIPTPPNPFHTCTR